jgi:hypothetical protein
MGMTDKNGKTNLGLNIVTLAGVLIAIIVGGSISAGLYQQGEHNTESIAVINATLVAFIQSLDERAKVQNEYRNVSLLAQNETLFQLIDYNNNLTTLVNIMGQLTNATLINQELYFKPYLNESFGKIFKALNITEEEENED